MSNYEPIIGLEVHVELKTNSKMFCSCSADYFGKKPNTHTCPVCLGMPGALPVPNNQAIEWCIRLAKALNCEINLFSKFDRKNYFYPDLAKGYQLSQYDLPFGKNGWIEVNGQRIGITRVHMEEDTAKMTHGKDISQIANGKSKNEGSYTLIDYNRSGVPLVEIVTEPDIHDGVSAKEYLKKLAQIVRYLGVSNADMEKGDMRLEPNISLRRVILANEVRPESQPDSGQAGMTKRGLPNYKVEVKNINSFSFVEKAIAYEIKRHAELLDRGETPKQETRGYDEDRGVTISQRSKEEAHDYRYFPEPDIPPIVHTEEQIIQSEEHMPELPGAKAVRFMSEYALSESLTEMITRDRDLADYFERALRRAHEAGSEMEPKTIANWLLNKKVDINKVTSEELLKQIKEETQVATIEDETLNKILDQVIAENPKAVADYKSGKEVVIMFLVGQVFKAAQMKLDAQMVREKLVVRINE